MRISIIFKMLLSILGLFCVQASVRAQGIAISQESAQQAVEQLFSSSSTVSISNVTFTGDQKQLGVFNHGSNPSPKISIADGVILSTGNIADAVGPNHNLNTTAFNGAGDADLNTLSAGTTKDAAILEFEFEALDSRFSFEVVYASDEYECAGWWDQYRDVIGFFLSGPGISGPYNNNAVNLAFIPGTTIPISTQDINPNSNSAFFNDNRFVIRSLPNCTGTAGSGNQTDEVDFEGWTNKFTVSADGLTCGETYRLKIAIADVRDLNLDSYLLFKEGSFDMEGADIAINDPGPLCDGSTVTLSAGPVYPGYTYSWSTGGTGSSTTFIADAGSPEVTLTVTKPDGCIFTRSINLDISPFNTWVPTINLSDIEACGYAATVRVGEEACVNFQVDDQDGDGISLSYTNLPSNAELNVVGQPGSSQQGQLCWTPGESDIGVHCFSVKATDNNNCPKEEEVQFCIKVICESCTANLAYENRSVLANKPLPEISQAVGLILAGYDVDPAQSPNGKVILDPGYKALFESGCTIMLQDGVDIVKGSDFSAVINPLLCTTEEECETCCEQWEGFSDNIFVPSYFSPNGDDTNEVWQVVDYDNPDCAYGAVGYRFVIHKDASIDACTLGQGAMFYYDEQYAGFGECCPFVSPDNPNSSTIASIHWDGTMTNWLGQKILAPDDQYFYCIELTGCDGSTTLLTGHLILDTDGQVEPVKEDPLSKESRMDVEAGDFSLYPNPSNGKVQIEASDKILSMTLVDAQGKIWLNVQPNDERASILTEDIPTGIYTITTKTSTGIRYNKLVIK